MSDHKPSTFLAHEQSPVADACAVFLPLPYEGTVSYLKGVADSPRAIIEASGQLEECEEELLWEPTTELKLHTHAPLDPRENEPPESYIARIGQTLGSIPKDTFLIGLGGEHTVTLPLVRRGLPKGGTVIAFDAHSDMRESYEGSKFSHACVMRRVNEEGYRVFQMGIGVFSMGEAEYLRGREDVKQYWGKDLSDRAGLDRCLADLGRITGDVYLSIDCDGLCTSYMPGVGTPVPGGVTWHYLMEILRAVFFNPNANVTSMDLVEMRPLPDNPLSEFSSARILQKCLSYKFRALKP